MNKEQYIVEARPLAGERGKGSAVFFTPVIVEGRPFQPYVYLVMDLEYDTPRWFATYEEAIAVCIVHEAGAPEEEGDAARWGWDWTVGAWTAYRDPAA